MKKDNSANIKKYIFSTFFVLLILAEIFVAINYPDQFMWMIGIGALILVNNYLLIHNLTQEVKEEKEKQTKQLQHIDRSKKALYILFKKNFMDLDKRMYDVEQSVGPISNELETNQKKMEDVIVQSMEDNRKVAKIIIGRNKESAEALMNYNGELAEKLRAFEEKLGEIESKVSKAQAMGFVVEQEEAMAGNEATFIDSISTASTVKMEAANDVAEENIEDIFVESATGLVDEIMPEIESDVQQTVAPIVEDSNKMMSPDDIAALLASIGGDNQEAANDVAEENIEDIFVESATEFVDEVMPEAEIGLVDEIMPEIESNVQQTVAPIVEDPNKMMSPDDIAALLASMNGSADEMSDEIEPEELGFEAMEEKAAPDFSDPNKMMSPEDIAALIANMQ